MYPQSKPISKRGRRPAVTGGMDMTNIPIGEVLKEKGYITGEQLNAALEIHRRSGKRVGDVLVEMGLVTERQILSAMAQKMNLQILSLETCPVDIEAVRRIPRTLADKYCAIAVSQANQRLTVVIDDPLKFYGIEDIRQLTGMTVDTALAERREIEHAIDVYYSEIEARRAASAVAADPLPDVAQAIREIEEGDETPVIAAQFPAPARLQRRRERYPYRADGDRNPDPPAYRRDAAALFGDGTGDSILPWSPGSKSCRTWISRKNAARRMGISKHGLTALR